MGEPLTRIILDTELAMGAPGSDIDDGFALALAIADPCLSVDVFTTDGGNSDVVTSTADARAAGVAPAHRRTRRAGRARR